MMWRRDETKGRRRLVTSLFTLLTLILSLAAPVWPPVPAWAGERVTFRMNWYWRGIQAPFALALERRYFEQAGLDVELLEGRGSATTVQLVGTKADTFGFADGFTVMLNAARGVPVRAVATPINGSSFALVSLEEAGIRGVKDLEGKRLGITPGDGNTQVWPAVVAAKGLRSERIQLVQMDPRAKGPALTERRVDAVLGSAADLPVTLGLRGFRTRVLTFAELGVPAVGFTIIAHPDTIRDRPDVVRRLVAASLRGFEEASRAPDAAVRALTRLAPLVEAEAARHQLTVDLSFLFSPANVRRRIGYGPPEDWQATLDTLKRYRELDTTLPADAFYTNEFVP
jgi:NitT/TauT family transport system substrate-binding protein